VNTSTTKIAFAVAAALATAASLAPAPATAVTAGKYVAGDFHNHTTCADGSASVQKLIKTVDKSTSSWGLDWFVYATHGNGGGTRNCTLTEDSSLDSYSPITPFVTGTSPATTWTNSIGNGNVYGDQSAPPANPGYMWRWQSTTWYEYPLIEYLAIQHNLPLFVGIEQNSPGHEHISTSVINGQMPNSIDNGSINPGPALPIVFPRVQNAYGNAAEMAFYTYCFDQSLTDLSRGNASGLNNNNSGPNNNYDCSVPGSLNSASSLWNTRGAKLVTSGSTAGTDGHYKTLEGIKWMKARNGQQSYFIPAHLERPGPFNPQGNNGYNIEHLRDFNNAAPNVAFGFESQPGHGAADTRGEYNQTRNGGFPTSIASSGTTDSAGGTTYGGTGVYAGFVGGVWDALLGEGRNWWFFASSDFHARGTFSNDDRRTNADFFPGEYQRSYTMVRNGTDKIRPQTVVDGLRTGNTWSAQGQLIDRLAFVACSSAPGIAGRTNASVEALARTAAFNGTDISVNGCATMGQKLVMRPGYDVIVAVVVRDPDGKNFAPYSFPNPSLAQINVTQPINQPVLDHVDLIRGLVTGYKTPGAADYSGQWPANTNWMNTNGSLVVASDSANPLVNVPAGAKNTSTAIIKTFSSASPWTQVISPVDQTKFLSMSYRIQGATASQYVRLRGTNLPPSTPYETDTKGNPLPDIYTNAKNVNSQGLNATLRIPCTTVGTNVPGVGSNPAVATWTEAMGTIDGCPAHLGTAPVAITANGKQIAAGTKMVSYDVAAWADLWFYSNPIYVEVTGSTVVAGVN
jgi:hypothetical protein